MEKYDRAVETFDSPDLAALLAAAADHDSPGFSHQKEAVRDNNARNE